MMMMSGASFISAFMDSIIFCSLYTPCLKGLRIKLMTTMGHYTV